MHRDVDSPLHLVNFRTVSEGLEIIKSTSLDTVLKRECSTPEFAMFVRMLVNFLLVFAAWLFIFDRSKADEKFETTF